LTTSSNLVACTTGRSAGLAPKLVANAMANGLSASRRHLLSRGTVDLVGHQIVGVWASDQS
jgi:hypothetical protein